MQWLCSLQENKRGKLVESNIVIPDCRGKEFLVCKRKGGDYELRFINNEGETVFVFWFAIKPPVSQNSNIISRLLQIISELVLRRNNY